MLDQQAVLSEDQAVTASAISTNVYDRGTPGTDVNGNTAPHDAGQSEINLEVEVTESFATLTSLNVQLLSSDNADLSSPITTVETGAIVAATLVNGYRFVNLRLPRGSKGRYIGAKYVVAGSSATAGKVTSYLSFAPQA